MTQKKDDPMEETIEKFKPALAQIGFGSIVGYCSGAATKKIGRALAVVLGLGFMLVQGAAYSGYVDVDWSKIRDDSIKQVDTDGDGKLTVDDIKVYWKKVKKVLTHKVPSASGFSFGFLYGISNN